MLLHGPSGARGSRSWLPAAKVPWLVSLMLFLATLTVYWPVRNCDFVDYDDPFYFSDNPHVLAGLSWNGVHWAFSNAETSNWHPLTWLSLMSDVTLFGRGPVAPHLVNVLFHAANSVLLFLWIRRLTSTIWPGAMVAALFALHPMHVESVAWVAERKDVLCLFFELLCLYAYASWAQIKEQQSANGSAAATARNVPRLGVYFASLFFFVLALISKPMAVTLPFLLLLLDLWPLGRVSSRASLVQLAREKIPFFVLSAGAAVITFIVQQKGGAVATLTRFSWTERVENAFVSYARYLDKLFWPVSLANPYPHPGFWPLVVVVASILLFVVLTLAAIRLRRPFPWLFMGWLWFVGTLVPVIGLVQVGSQSMADRYSYLPSIGLFIALVWTVAELFVRWGLPRLLLGLLSILVIFSCACLTRHQLAFWKDSGTLFAHALAVTRNNYTACVNLGTWLSKNGQTQEALEKYQQALQMSPADPSVWYDVGNAYARMAHWGEAVSDYRRALEISPDQPDVLDNLGFALSAQKQYSEAIAYFEAALKENPDSAKIQNNLATALFMQGRFEESAKHYYEAVRLAPDEPRFYTNLGDVMLKLGNAKAAAECYEQALRLEPSDARVKGKLAALGVAP